MKLLGAMVLGLVAAMLVNYLADVLPWEAKPGHFICSKCGGRLTVAEYAKWWTKCPHCGQRRWRHGAVLVGLALFSGALWLFPGKWGFWAMWALIVYFALVTVIDVEHRLILHEVNAAGVLLLGYLGLWRHGVRSTAIGGMAGAGVMLLLFLLGNGYAYWKARRAGEPPPSEPALGFGDVLLATNLGLLLGWPGIAAGLTLAILFAGIFSLAYVAYAFSRWREIRLDAYIPYGPFLLLGALVAIWV